MKLYTGFVIIAIVTLTIILPAGARKIGYKHKTGGKKASVAVVARDAADSDTVQEMVPGSFMVASQCERCNNGYRLDQVVFTGFDKKRGSAKESFFIINKTDRVLTGVSLFIDYRTPDGRQLTRRFIKLSCSIPPGETRKADIDTWDTQRSFYYVKSVQGKKGGNPFEVVFDPIAYWLRFDEEACRQAQTTM